MHKAANNCCKNAFSLKIPSWIFQMDEVPPLDVKFANMVNIIPHRESLLQATGQKARKSRQSMMTDVPRQAPQTPIKEQRFRPRTSLKNDPNGAGLRSDSVVYGNIQEECNVNPFSSDAACGQDDQMVVTSLSSTSNGRENGAVKKRHLGSSDGEFSSPDDFFSR